MAVPDKKPCKEPFPTKHTNQHMNPELYKSFLQKAHFGFACIQAETNDDGEPRDFQFLEANEAFCSITRLNPGQVIGKKASQLVAETSAAMDWLRQPCLYPLPPVNNSGHPSPITIHGQCYNIAIHTIENKTFSLVLTRPDNAGPTPSESADNNLNEIADNPLTLVQQTYHDIFNSLTEAIYILDDTSRFIEVNKGAEIMYGFSRGELIGRSPQTVAAPGKNNMAEIAQRLTNVNATGIPEKFEFWAIRKNGEIFPKEVIVNKGCYFGKSVLIATARDISEIKKTNQTLIDSILKFHNLIELAVEGILIGSSEGIIIDANSRFCEMTGWTRDELCGQHITQLPFTPESIEKSPFRFDLLQKGEVVVSERQLILSSGNVMMVEMRTKMMPDRTYQSIYIDITAHNKAIAELKNAHETMKLAADAAHFGIWDIDLNLQRLEWSEWMHRIYGTDPGKINLKALSHRDFVHPEDLKQLMANENAALISDRYYSGEFRIIRPDGEIRHLLSKALITRDQDHKPIRVTGLNYDITETKLAECKLREGEANLKAIIENALESIWSIDLGYNISYTNKVFADAFEQSFGTRLDRGVNILRALPESLRQIWKARYDRAFNGEYTVFTDAIDVGSVTIYIEVSVQPIVLDNKVIGASFYGRDITEQKLAEEALRASETNLRTLIEALPDGVFFKDGDGRWITVNNAALELFQLKGSDFAGKTDEELIPLTPHFAAALEQCNQSDKKTWEKGKLSRFEEEITDENGRLFVFDTLKIPLFNDDGSRKGLVIIGRDITSRKLSEESLRDSETKMRELNASKDKFFSIIAHDLRSPFSSIVGFSELMLEQIEANDLEDIGLYAKQILQSSRKSMDLLTNLMTWARSQTNRIDFKPEPLPIGRIIDDHIRFFTEAAMQKSIHLVNEANYRTSVTADREMLNTVLRNLIGNAIKFTNTGGEISVSVAEKPDEALVSVSDNGIGMDPEMVQGIFRLDTTTGRPGTNNEPSTGLGLIICKEFVEKHGGLIWVESATNKGSKFHFSLPLSLKSTAGQTKENTPPPPRQKTVLVADDDYMGYLVVKSMLRKENLKTIHTTHAQETLKAIVENPELPFVIVNNRLPDTNFPNIIWMIREVNPSIPIVVLTDQFFAGEKRGTTEAGNVYYLTKPISRQQLGAIMQKINMVHPPAEPHLP